MFACQRLHSHFLYFIACIILLTSICSVAAGSEQPSVQVISSNESGVILELTLPPFEMEETTGPDGIYHNICLPKWAKTSTPGHPQVPFASLLIQVPSTGEITVSVLEASYVTLPDYRIYPAPMLSLSESGQTVTTFYKNEAVYRLSEFYPGEQAIVDSGAVLRGVPVSRLNIYPFQCNPGAGQLRYATRLRLEIRFQNPMAAVHIRNLAPLSPSRKDPFHEILPEVIINYSPPAKSISPMASLASLPSPEARPGLRAEIRKEGLYRISYEDLSPLSLNAGLDPGSIEPGTLQLFNRDTETPIHVVSSGDRFSPGDYIEFYGHGIDTSFTDNNVYRLYWGEGPGKRITLSDGSLSGQGMQMSSFFHRLHFEENHTIWEGMSDALNWDYWFWEKLTAPTTKEHPVFIPSPEPASDSATVRVCFRGRSTSSPHPNHHTVIYLNGVKIGDAFRDGDAEFIQETTISREMINPGPNVFKIQLPGDTGAAADIVYLNWIEVDYHRRMETVLDELAFVVNGDGPLQMSIEGFSRPDIRILEVTDPAAVTELAGFPIESNGPVYRAIFDDHASGENRYYAVTEGQVKKPDKLEFVQPSSLKSPQNGADYILIIGRELVSSVEPLCLFRSSQGLRVKAVAVEEIYDAFNFGIFDPRAIKDFLTYAYQSWTQPAPTYVLLVGDANTDYRDYLASGKENRAPVHLSMTSGLGITPDDNWYACVDGGDDLPDMFIGRIPGNSAEAVAAVVDKILQYEQDLDYHPKDILFVADDNEMAFDNLNENLIADLSQELIAHRVYLRAYPGVDAAAADIISKINQGMLMVNYVGHGAVTNWAGEYLFEPSDIGNLTNLDRLPFIATFTCLNGYFSQPFHYSLAEEFLAAPEKGAVAVFSPSGLGYVWEHEILDKELFSLIFGQRKDVIGAAATQSKIAAYSRGTTPDILKTFTFFGDPACRLKRWADLRGDITGDGIVDISDVVAGLQVMTGMTPAVSINSEVDVNGDGKIGLEEVLNALRKLATK